MLIQLFYSLLHSVDLHGGCSSQHTSPWSCLTLLRSKGLWREITQKHWQNTPACVSAGHRWHKARLKAPGMSWWRKSEGCTHSDGAIWGEEPPGHWQSIQMEAILHPSREWLANVPIPYLRGSISSIWCMNEGEWEWVGGDVMWQRRGRQSLCVLWSLSYGFSLSCVSLQGHLGNLAVEGIRTLKIRRWVQASNPERSHSITCDIWPPPAKVKIYVVCGRNKYGVCLLLGTGAGQTKHDTKEKQNSSTQWILQAPKRLYWWNILVQDDFREQTSSTDTFNFYLFICCRNSADREITKPSYTSAKCMFSWWLLLLCWPSWKCYFSFFQFFY